MGLIVWGWADPGDCGADPGAVRLALGGVGPIPLAAGLDTDTDHGQLILLGLTLRMALWG